MKRYAQVYLGGVLSRNITEKELEEKLQPFAEGRADGMIAGWSLELSLYQWLRKFTQERNMQLFLWLPVFSEFGKLKAFPGIQDIWGEGIASAVFDEDEEFHFHCPSNPKTIECLKQIYEKYFEGIGFDGVFLDRIRFPSPGTGWKSLFSCTCEFCMEKYRGYGILREDIRQMAEREREKKDGGFLTGIRSYKNGKYMFENSDTEIYMKARTRLITDSVVEIAGYFRQKGLVIGLDLFAPFMSVFVGQDYTELSEYADFVKPMLYRYTDTPAGMEYELSGVIRELSGKTDKRKFRDLFGIEESGISGFMEKEARAAVELSECEVMAGMEIHTLPELPAVRADQITEGISRLQRAGVHGRIASWNVLCVQRENAEAFMREE